MGLESTVTNASQSEGVVKVNLVNERRRHRENIEALKKDNEQEKIMLGKKHENELDKLRKQVTFLGKELEERAKTTKTSELKPETPDENT